MWSSGPPRNPYTSETLIDGLRIVKGRRIGLVWTDTTAWLVYFDGVSALRVALESVGFFWDAAALVRIDGGEVDEALPYHEKKWWEGLAGERRGMSDQPWAHPLLPLGGTVLLTACLSFLLTAAGVPVLITAPLYLLMAAALAMQTWINVVAWSRGRRVDAFPVRDILGMSAWAREADQE